MSEFRDQAGNPVDLAKLAELIEATSIWRPKSVEQEPQTRLLQWRVMLVQDKDIHFVGRADWEGRVCSAVQTYDPETKRGVTRSGRIYELLGHPGYNGDAMYVWGRWMSMNGLTEEDVKDVTDQYYTEGKHD